MIEEKSIETPEGMNEELLSETDTGTQNYIDNRNKIVPSQIFSEALKYSNGVGEFELYSNSLNISNLAEILLVLIERIPELNNKKVVGYV